MSRRLYARIWGGIEPVDRAARALALVVIVGAGAVIFGAQEDAGTSARSGAVVTAARGSTPVLLDGTEARILDASVVPQGLRLRVRLRNESGREQRPDPRSLYVVLGGRRLYPQWQATGLIRSGEGRTLSTALELAAADRDALRRAEGRAELRIVPWPLPGPGRVPPVGVIRFRVDVPDDQARRGRQT